MELEPASYRERQSQVFYHQGEVFRGLGESARLEWESFKRSRFFVRQSDSGIFVRTDELSSADVKQILSDVDGSRFSAILRHERVPFISYPYEWCFGMLKEAAQTQLALLEEALQEGLISKDASPYNFQWRGTRICSIDLSSWVRLDPSHPWAGWVAHRQFCEMFLFPLMLQSHRGVAFQSLLRGRLDGVSLDTMRGLMSLGDLFKAGVWSQVVLQSLLEKSLSRRSSALAESPLDLKLRSDLIRSTIRRFSSQVASLKSNVIRSEWSRYDSFCPYTSEDRELKESFVKRALKRRAWKQVWDLGCNEGRFSKIASESSECVIALDSDPSVIETLYQEMRQKGQTRILPLVMNLVDSSPACGWRGMERMTLQKRGRPDLILCLGLLHHWSLAQHVPLAEIVSYLFELGGELVIEFPTRQDAWVNQLIHSRAMAYEDYDLSVFERLLEDRYEIRERLALCQGSRVIYWAVPR